MVFHLKYMHMYLGQWGEEIICHFLLQFPFSLHTVALTCKHENPASLAL